MVGRTKNIPDPYLDKDGKSLATGGGTLLLIGDKNWYGVGHNAVANFDGANYLVFHVYDASDNGRSKLLIRKINWDKDGWPQVTL